MKVSKKVLFFSTFLVSILVVVGIAVAATSPLPQPGATEDGHLTMTYTKDYSWSIGVGERQSLGCYDVYTDAYGSISFLISMQTSGTSSTSVIHPGCSVSSNGLHTAVNYACASPRHTEAEPNEYPHLPYKEIETECLPWEVCVWDGPYTGYAVCVSP